MKAFVLAAGRGERMRPLTDTIPKPLVPLNGKPLIDYQLEKLYAAGIRDVVINVAYLGELIEQHVGKGERYDLNIQISREPEPLETGGALFYARDLIGENEVLLVNGDVWTNIDYSEVLTNAQSFGCVDRGGAHLVLVKNPPFKTRGDFTLIDGKLNSFSNSETSYTFSGISVLSSKFIKSYPNAREKFPLKEMLDWGISQAIISCELKHDYWNDVGTPDRLSDVEAFIRN